MRLVLASGGVRTEERRLTLVQAMRDLFGDAERVLFIPYAIADHESALAFMQARFGDAGYTLTGIHQEADPVAAVHAADAIYVGGGNSFRLLRDMYANGVLDPIRERVRMGVPYLGVSAGSNVACPTIRTTNDMPITSPPSMDALGLVGFQVNPHFVAGSSFVVDPEGRLSQHFGETREQRIAEFHEEHDIPVVGLWEGSLLRIEDGAVTLDGGPARLFRRGEAAVDFAPGATLPLPAVEAGGSPSR